MDGSECGSELVDGSECGSVGVSEWELVDGSECGSEWMGVSVGVWE